MKKNIFFDIDGTLHQEDIFLQFILFSAKHRIFNFIVFFPVILLGAIIHYISPMSKIGINIILFFIFFNIQHKELDFIIEKFCSYFLAIKTDHHNVLDIMNDYINHDYIIYLISGSPDILIQKIHHQIIQQDNVCLICTTTKMGYNSLFITQRCVGINKLTMLNHHQKNIYFHAGYSDSSSDQFILDRCRQVYMISKSGEII
ncbi:hypothetical protein LU293_06605 [Moraxella nasovis]|uniref:HAD family hydrolase n=1 Tax=Moraxella nasovis TaxID=2904121 RepID=UPI001F61113D|nr:HAD family hydrolase [Moraxella nasovis]UNU72777.1 hypothetical protein LU293_06605 [Moraxella nasovis]